MLLWQPATVFCVVYFLCNYLTWQINSLSRGGTGPPSNTVLLGITRASLPNGISFCQTALPGCTTVTRYSSICHNKRHYLFQRRCLEVLALVSLVLFYSNTGIGIVNTFSPKYYYLRQVNEVNGGDTVFVRCVSVCLSVCLCVCAQRSGQSDQFKTVEATYFKFDTHVPRDSPDMTAKNFPKRWRV